MGELRRIPGIGAVGERDLLELGYTTIQSLAGADPEEMYARECARKGVRVDRCVLYVYRCAGYYAFTPQPDPGAPWPRARRSCGPSGRPA